jgi:intracellular sulfur oxidation DsrE/DsrF family protein
MKYLIAMLAALIFIGGSGASFAADQPATPATKPAVKKANAAAGKYQVVIQVSDADPRGWAQALNYTENLQETLGKDNVEIELVALGQGIGILKLDSPHATRVAEALKRNVKIQACEISMRRQKLGKDDMLSDIGYVPAGLVEIIILQRKGWSYIKG